MSLRSVPETVRRRALATGAEAWLDGLGELVADLEREWSLTVGSPYGGGSEAFVAEASREDGTAAVLKVLIPNDDAVASHEITALRLAEGEGCAQLFRADVERRAMLLERLGRPLSALGLSTERSDDVLCATVARMWRPAAGSGLPTGADKARWLIDFIERSWEELGRPCSERAIEHAVACAGRRSAAHDDERAVLVHGDVHEWNALEAGDGFKLVDPDGLLAEAEYDLGVVMRETPPGWGYGEIRDRSAALAARTELDEAAIWEWSAVERVSTGLVCTSLHLPAGRPMLEVADRIARHGRA